jgi:3-hydroxyisobutyrate dehydrogenase-like beta-hydroxyacid dehydrogenase
MPDRKFKLAFLGTGNMGREIAQLLLDDGHALTVWNRTADKLKPLLERGARAASTPADAARGAEAVFSSMGGDPSVEELMWGAGVLKAMPAGSIHVGTSTISPALASRLAEAHRAAGSVYLGTPVFGRPDAIGAHQLWIVSSGPEAAFKQIQPMLERLGRGLTYAGEDAASAHLIKIGGNFLIASMLEALAESFALVERNGVKPLEFLQVVDAVFRSPVYKNYGQMMANRKLSPAAFALRWGLKDVNLVRATADASDVPMPLADLLRQHLVACMAKGRGDLDWMAISLIAREMAGLPI